MSAILGMILGTDVLVVGIEDDPVEKDDDGTALVRIYIVARYLHTYVLVDQEAGERARRAWASCQHMTIARPPTDRIYVDPPEGTHEPAQ